MTSLNRPFNGSAGTADMNRGLFASAWATAWHGANRYFAAQENQQAC